MTAITADGNGLASLAGTSVLVTGSSGFLGFPVAEGLAEIGSHVTGLDPVAPRNGSIRFPTVAGDLDDIDAVHRLLRERRIELVVHCGAVSGPMLARDDPLFVGRMNVVGTLHLLEAARLEGVTRFVYCSSAAALGDTGEGTVPEDATLRPKDVYGATKGAGELMLRGYREQFGLSAVSLRIANAYGPRRSTRCAVKSMLEDALAGRPTRMNWGRGYRRPYLYVDDAVSAILLAAAARTVPQAVYNLGGPEYPSMDEIAAIVGDVVAGARISLGDGMDALAYRRGALDVSAAQRDLSFQPRYTIRAGITAYATWMRSRPG
jgi:UDP-glucuronate 4-epimerase